MVSLSLLATGILRIVGLALGWFWKGIRGDFKWLSKSIRDCQVEFSRQITSDEWILYQISIWLKNFTFKDGIYIIFNDNIINAFPYKIYYKKRQLHYKAWIYIIIWQLHILLACTEVLNMLETGRVHVWLIKRLIIKTNTTDQTRHLFTSGWCSQYTMIIKQLCKQIL